ncbi:MAG: flagellar hook-associated protein 2 [Acidobacteriota bacterium]
MSLSPLTFTGVSQFSNDFQTILDRAVKIAQVPIQAAQNRDADVIQKKTLLSGFSAGVSGLASTLEALSEVASKRALAASSSDQTVVTATNSGALSAATYTINSVTSVAKAASERSVSGYADSAATPVGTTGAFRLKVGSDTYDFTPTSNTLVGLRDKINTLGAGVTASILTTAGGNYLSVTANASGAKTLELRDDPQGANTNLLTAANQGSDLVFHLNGIQVQQSRNLVNSVVPGLTFTVLKESADPVTMTVSSDRSQLTAALQSFVQAYNTVRGQVNSQTGASAGLLTGDAVVLQLGSQLRQISAQRLTSGSVKGLADLGVTFDSTGTMKFDSSVVDGFTSTQLDDAFTFLADSSEGLGRFADSLRQISDPITGLIKVEQDGLDRVDRSLQDQIAKLTDRLAVMRRGLSLRLQQADTLLAALESQQNTVKASLQGLNVVLYGKQQG